MSERNSMTVHPNPQNLEEMKTIIVFIIKENEYLKAQIDDLQKLRNEVEDLTNLKEEFMSGIKHIDNLKDELTTMKEELKQLNGSNQYIDERSESENLESS